MYNEKHERLTINQSKVELGIVFYYIDVGRLRHIFRNHEFFRFIFSPSLNDSETRKYFRVV